MELLRSPVTSADPGSTPGGSAIPGANKPYNRTCRAFHAGEERTISEVTSMARATAKGPPIELIVWANIQKWAMIRQVPDEDIARVLGIARLDDRKRKLLLSVQEMGSICALLAIEPEKLLER